MDRAFDQWWRPKATNLLAVLYAVTFVTDLRFAQAIVLIGPSILTIFGIGTVGHLLNDWHDMHADAAIGKSNRLAGVPPPRAAALLAGALVLALLPWVVLPWDGVSAGLLLIELALLVAYAVPPVRLKERRTWPVFADAAYAYAVPAVLAAHTFNLAAGQRVRGVFLGVLFAWQLALGVRHFLNHLALDRHNDIVTRTPTLATEKGNRFIHRLVRWVVLPVEVAGFVGFLALLGQRHLALPVTFAALVLIWSSVQVVLTGARRSPLGPYRFSKTHLDRLYQDILPLALLLFLTSGDWRFGFLLAGHALMFSTRAGRVITRDALLLPLMISPQVARHVIAHRAPRPAPSVTGTAARAGVPIAVVNINKLKYTETFVHEAIPNLHYDVHYLYGGELPRFDGSDQNFLSNWPSVQTLARLLELLLRLDADYFLKNSIAGYLQAREIRLILAHFGPVGARMLPIARDLGIPLVVHFHGYDVFHQDTLRQYADEYKSLFAGADRIIGVSEVMLNRLHELGAPKDKLVHLPAFVNLALFSHTDHAAIGPRFLAVGRFAETKSPHLTILAFQRVAQRIPDATLTMIGKGGGGELFEACLILVKSLGLEDRVALEGVQTHGQVADAMRRARVFVQHSVTTPEHGDMEGKPVAVMEAMACGLPVVSTRHSGNVELIEDGETGFLVDEYDIGAMADAMVRLAEDDALVSRVGRNASTRICGDPLIRDHIAILEELIGSSIARN